MEERIVLGRNNTRLIISKVPDGFGGRLTAMKTGVSSGTHIECEGFSVPELVDALMAIDSLVLEEVGKVYEKHRAEKEARDQQWEEGRKRYAEGFKRS